MSSANTTLNYIGIFSLYVICFVFMYNKLAGAIAMASITVIHIISTMFIGNEFLNFVYSNPIDNVINDWFAKIALLSIVIGSGMHIFALILIMLMIVELQKKYNNFIGTQIQLPSEYQYDFDNFKLNMIKIFAISCILMYLIIFKRIVYPNVHIIMKIMYIAAGMTILWISKSQIMIAINMSKLPKRSIIVK